MANPQQMPRRENQQGRYFGVGMYIFAPEGKVLVSYPFINSPAWKAVIPCASEPANSA